MRIKVSTEYYPRLTEWHVRRALTWINPLDLVGVESIHLLDEETLTTEARKQPFYLRDSVCGGEYLDQRNKRQKQVSRIKIYTRHLYHGIPSLFKLSPIATLRTAFVLAHEVGHHLIERRSYIYEPTEEYQPYGISKKYDGRHERMANSYARDVLRSMCAVWYYRIGRWLGGFISRQYFYRGIVVWKKHQYRRAAYYWFCSYLADPDNTDAARGHMQAVTRVFAAEAKSDDRVQPAAR